MRPFKEILKKNYRKRTFSPEDSDEMVWHWDDTDRLVVPLHDTDWMFEAEWDDKPVKISGPIAIPAGCYHRLKAGKGELQVMVIDLPEGTVNPPKKAFESKLISNILRKL